MVGCELLKVSTWQGKTREDPMFIHDYWLVEELHEHTDIFWVVQTCTNRGFLQNFPPNQCHDYEENHPAVWFPLAGIEASHHGTIH